MTLKTFFDIMERIHFNFGMPYQWQSLTETMEGVICE